MTHEMLVQAALRSGSMTLESLTKTLGVSAKIHPGFPELVMLKYDQIESPMGDPIVQECRGVILNKAKNWEVVSRPFDKFFNYGDHHAKPLDWSTARVQEKLDGSLISLYWYSGAWRVASSGIPNAGGPVKGFVGTFADLFLQVLAENGLVLPREDERRYTFMFELMTKYNRIVVKHDTSRVSLIGVRNSLTGIEERTSADWRDANMNPYPSVREFQITTPEQIVASFEHIDPLSQEGYVVVDSAWNRAKVKHPGYVALHHMTDASSPKAFLEIVRSGEVTEVLLNFPEWSDEILGVKALYEGLITDLLAAYGECKDIDRQKEFAAQIQAKAKMTAPLFKLRAAQEKDATVNPAAFIKRFLKETPVKSLMSHLGMKDVE